MPEKLTQSTSELVTQLITFAWVMGLSAWGGAIGYIHKIFQHKLKFSIWRFLGELSISAFVGVITFLLCDSADFGWETTAAFVGISGHMGARAIFVLEDKYTKLFGEGSNGNS